MSEYCATDCDADAAAPHSLYANDKYARPSVGCMRATGKAVMEPASAMADGDPQRAGTDSRGT
jgi:hypothetical protein